MLKDVVTSVRVVSNSGVSDAAGGLAGLVIGALMLVFAAFLGPILAFEHVLMRPDFVKFTKTNESGLSKGLAQLYVAVTPDVKLPSALVQPGEQNYKPGKGVAAAMSNLRWGVAAAYLVGGWLLFAAQLAVVYGMTLAMSKVVFRLWWLPAALAVVHYALPYYLMTHFKYVKYMSF